MESWGQPFPSPLVVQSEAGCHPLPSQFRTGELFGHMQ